MAQTNNKRPMRRNPDGQNDFETVRYYQTAEIRSTEDDNERRFELSFSSEEPYDRWYGTEILDHTEGCIQLERLNSIGVLLFNHNTNKVLGKVEKAWIENGKGKSIVVFDEDEESEIIRQKVSIGVLLFNHNTNKVLGKVEKAWIENGKGKSIVVFDEDEESEIIRQKVDSGTLKTVSVGYTVDVWEEVKPGKKSSDGRFTGPCYIAKKWTPLEVSIAPVPADPTVGVGRSRESGFNMRTVDVFEKMILMNKNQMRSLEVDRR